MLAWKLCKLLGTDMLQVPATFRLDDGVTGDVDKVVSDLRELAVRLAASVAPSPRLTNRLSLSPFFQDLGLKESPPIRFTYEAIAWSTTNNTWQLSWDIVQRVARPNFGLVLDAFHIAAYEYADPTVPGGVRPDGPARLAASLAELAKEVPGDRVFYVQVTDAERLDTPLVEGGKSPYWVEGQQPWMSWSRNCRLFPYEVERGAYLPIEDVVRTFVATGFEGWVRYVLSSGFVFVIQGVNFNLGTAAWSSSTGPSRRATPPSQRTMRSARGSRGRRWRVAWDFEVVLKHIISQFRLPSGNATRAG